ncbi:MAG: hypothetical protein EPN25_03315 [Nitrospirae bacterium]|nr:MAG: hypothetical protein EPN25_03315 [Nitrospirota bacterium]
MDNVFAFLVVPHFIVGMGILGASRAKEIISAEAREHFIYFVVFIAVLMLPYAWYRAFHAFFALMKDNVGNIPETVVCLNCEEPYFYDKIKTFKCPKCGGTLEDLEGFYERHPDMKNANK